MFDFLDLDFGGEFEAYDQKWNIIKSLTHGWVLATKQDDSAPARVYLLQDPKLMISWKKYEDK